MSVNLYEEQRRALDSLHTGAILNGGVGTGKSRTSLAYFFAKECNGKLPTRRGDSSYLKCPKDLYIITPPKKRDSKEWEKEMIPFAFSKYAPGIKIVVDSWNNIKKYTEVENAFFIFDEQRVVGYGAWVKSFLKITRKNHWILLSATPGDTWMDYMPVFIANGFYKNKTEFCTRHVVYDPYSKFPKIKRYLDTGHLEKLRRKIVVTMSVEKTALMHHQWVKVGYDEELYERSVKNRWDFENGQPIKNSSEYVNVMRRITNSDKRRLQALWNLFGTHSRIIVFYNFNYELEMLRNFCDSNEIPYSEYNGHRHQEIPDMKSWIYLVHYASGSEAWNCITTDTILFYSMNYSYRSMIQGSGRIDRVNTPYSDLYCYHLFSDSDIDKAIKSCLTKKKDFNESVYLRKIGLQEKQSL